MARRTSKSTPPPATTTPPADPQDPATPATEPATTFAADAPAATEPTGAADAPSAPADGSSAPPASVSAPEAEPAAGAGSSPAAPTTPEPAISPIVPTAGRIVLVTLRNQYDHIETRPAIIVHVFERNDGQTPLVNLQVFLDGSNDLKDRAEGDLLWMTSAHYDPTGKPHTWRWMDYQKGQAAKNDGDVAALRGLLAETRRQLASLAHRAGHHLD